MFKLLSRRIKSATASTLSLMMLATLALVGISVSRPLTARADTGVCQVKTIWGVDGNGTAREYYAGAGRPNEGQPTGREVDVTGGQSGDARYNRDIALDPNGQWLWGINRAGSLAAFDIATGNVVRRVSVDYPGANFMTPEMTGFLVFGTETLNSLSFTTGGTLLIGGLDNYGSTNPAQHYIWSLDAGQLSAGGSQTANGFKTDTTSVSPGGWSGDFVTLADGSIIGFANQQRVNNSPSQFVYIPMINGSLGTPVVAGYPVRSDGGALSIWGGTFASGALYLAATDGNWYRVDTLPNRASSDNFVATNVGGGVGEFWGATGAQENAAACSSPAIDLVKTAGGITGPDANGNYISTYQVQVKNTGTGAGSYGPITDNLGFDSRLSVKSASWTGQTNGSLTGAGPYRFTTSNTNIAAGVTHTWTIKVTFSNPNSVNPSVCAGPGTGSYNSISLPLGDETNTNNNSACNPVPNPAPQPPVISLQKSGSLTPTTGNRVGDPVTYTFTVKNTGTTDVTALKLDDNKLGITGAPLDATTCASTTPTGWTLASVLKPSETVTCTARATYKLVQADIDAGKVDNHAIVNGTSVAGPAKAEADAQVNPVGTKSLKLTKDLATSNDVNNNKVLDPGDTLQYTFTLTNTGSVQLKNLTLTDDKLALTDAPINATLCALTPSTFDPAAGLAPGASVTCVPSKTYTIKAVDVTNGQHVLNVASSAGTAPDNSKVPSNQAIKDVPLATPPNVGITKTAGAISALDPEAGTYTATYQIKLTNSGQTPTAYTMTDTPKFSPSLLPSKATWTGASSGSATGAGPYTLGTGDIAGNSTLTWDIVVTFGYVNGAPQAGVCQPGVPNTGLFNEASVADRMSATACVDPPAPPKAALSLVKKAGAIVDANNNAKQDAGDTILYTFDVKNTGTVTLTSVNVTDPKVGAINCPQTTLAPGASMTCTAAKAYPLTQADIDAKNVHNDATANGTPPPGVTPPTPPTSSTDTPLTPHNAIALDKFIVRTDDTNGTNRTDAGDHLVYGFKITNTGTSTLSTIVLSDPQLKFTMNVPGTLAPGASITVTKDGANNEFKHLLSQSEIDAGSYTNTATVTATGPGPEKPTASDTEIKTFDQGVPSIALTKDALPVGSPQAIVDTNANGRADAGDTITYRFTITNTSLVTLTKVNLVDAKLNLANYTCGKTTLAPGEATSCDVNYTLTQADVDGRMVANAATAYGTDPKNTVVNAPASENVPVQAATSIGIKKTASAIVDVNNNGIDKGDRIDYTFVITNTGSVTLSNVKLVDAKLSVDEVVAATMAPGASVTVNKQYFMTQADVDAASRKVVNTASTTGTPPAGMTPPSAQDTAEVPFAAVVKVGLDKQAGSITDVNKNNKVDAGDTISYTFVVTNTGPTTLTKLTLTDPKLGLTGAKALVATGLNLAPGASYTFVERPSYALTQANIDAASFTNTASVLGEGPAGTATADATAVKPYDAGVGAINLVKKAGAIVDANKNNRNDAGDTVAYTFTITNISAVTLNAISLTDNKLGLAAASLDSTTCSNLTLDGATVSQVASLKPGQAAVCVATKLYTLSSADMLAGQVQNTATASGVDPKGTKVSDDDTATVTPQRTTSITLTKQATQNALAKVGDQITYSFVITNTGSVDLAPVVLNDAKLGLVNAPVAASLAAGASTTWTAPAYTLTQADVDAGKVDNTATVTGTPPAGMTPPKATDSVTRPVASNPGLTIVKTNQLSDLVGSNAVVDLGDQIDYSFLVSNTGNVTMSDIVVNDPMLAAAKVAISCPATTLNAGTSMTCTAKYAPTQAAIDAAAAAGGKIVNTATATGTPPNKPAVTTPPSSTDVPVNQATSLTLVKSVSQQDANKNGFMEEGEKLIFTFALTNKSAVTLTDPKVTDAMLATAKVAISCPAGPLAPGATVTCTSEPYTITAADAKAGEVRNTATASASDPKGNPVGSNPSSTVTPVDAKPALELIKKANLADKDNDWKADAGEVITYTFTVKNAGSISLSGLLLNDAKLGLTNAPMAQVCTSDPGTLAPGASVTCTLKQTYTVTQADVDAGVPLINVATVSAPDPKGGKPVESNKSETSTPVDNTPKLALTKKANLNDANADKVASVGETITYTFVVTNVGGVTVNGISVVDAMLTKAQVAVTCEAANLVPGASTTCTSGAYKVTAADVIAEKIVNVATARGEKPGGDPKNPADDVISNEANAEVPAKLIFGKGDRDGQLEYELTTKSPLKPAPAPAAVEIHRLANTGLSTSALGLMALFGFGALSLALGAATAVRRKK